MRFLEFFTPNFLDVIVATICVISVHLAISTISQKHQLGRGKSLLIWLYYYHLLFAIVFVFYILYNGGDSIGYWRPPTRFIGPMSSALRLHSPGSSFIHFLTYPFSQILGLSLWGGAFIFSLVGYFGFVCIYLTYLKLIPYNPVLFGVKLFPFVLFLPNMHFWSASVGKDTIIFFGLALFVYALTDFRKKFWWLALGFYLVFFTRPHIAFVCLIAFGSAVLLASKGISIFARVSFIIITIGVFIVVSPVVMNFIGVEEESIESYEDIASIRSKNLSRSSVGSSIAMSSYPLPLRIFTFLYRPLFFDGNSVLGMIVSIENVFYLLLSMAMFRWRAIKCMFEMPLTLKVCLLVVAATSFFMSSSLSNLGIIIRQKNMIMFMLVIVFVYVLSQLQYEEFRLRNFRRVGGRRAIKTFDSGKLG